MFVQYEHTGYSAKGVTTNQLIEKIKLHAQTHAEGFYKKLGYVTVSGEFMDAGIPHVEMVKKLSKKH